MGATTTTMTDATTAPPPPPRDDEDDDRDGCGNGGGRRSVGSSSSSGSARYDGGGGGGDDDDNFARLFENLAPRATMPIPRRQRRGRWRRRSGGIAPLPATLLLCSSCLGGDDFFDSDDRRHRPRHHHRHQRRRDQTTTTTTTTTTNDADNDDDRLAQLAMEEAELACSGISTWTNVPMETTGCLYYASCSEYDVFDVILCPDGTAFDSAMGGCNWIDSVACPEVPSFPTASPAVVATDAPTEPPTPTPPATDAPTTDAPAGPPTRSPRAASTTTMEPTLTMDVFDWMDERTTELNERVFRSYTHDGIAYPSYWFQYGDFADALRLVSGGGRGGSVTGDERHVFYVGDGDIVAAAAADGDVVGEERRRDAEAVLDDGGEVVDDVVDDVDGRRRRRPRGRGVRRRRLGREPRNFEYGLANIAAFLGHAMTDSIRNDACDEYHWELRGGRAVVVPTGDDADAAAAGGDEDGGAVGGGVDGGGSTDRGEKYASEFVCSVGRVVFFFLFLRRWSSSKQDRSPPPPPVPGRTESCSGVDARVGVFFFRCSLQPVAVRRCPRTSLSLALALLILFLLPIVSSVD